MNVGKSTRVALAKAGLKQKDLASMLGIKPQSLTKILGSTNTSADTVRKLADIFEMKCSEFISLGE